MDTTSLTRNINGQVNDLENVIKKAKKYGINKDSSSKARLAFAGTVAGFLMPKKQEVIAEFFGVEAYKMSLFSSGPMLITAGMAYLSGKASTIVGFEVGEDIATAYALYEVTMAIGRIGYGLITKKASFGCGIMAIGAEIAWPFLKRIPHLPEVAQYRISKVSNATSATVDAIKSSVMKYGDTRARRTRHLT